MRSAARLFYLALFAFSKLTNADHDEVDSRLHSADTCAVSDLTASEEEKLY